MNCPHCQSTLLWSEDRGAHCDGCDEYQDSSLAASPGSEAVDYSTPSPETEAFMLRIDDSEIDLGQVEAALSDMEHQRDAARARIKQLESYLDKTVDGKLLCETEHLYCPKCGREVRTEYDVAYCDHCPNLDDWPVVPPLPLFRASCFAQPQNNQIFPPEGSGTMPGSAR